MKLYNKILLILMPLVLLSVLLFCIFRNESFVFITENRESVTLKDIDAFDKIDDFLIDQFPKREKVIAIANSAMQSGEKLLLPILNLPVQSRGSRYLILDEKFYLPDAREKAELPYGQMKALLSYVMTFDQDVYFINAGGKQKHEDIYKSYGIGNPYVDLEKKFLSLDMGKIHVLDKYWDREEVLNYFYHTDHHLNFDGTMEIYKLFMDGTGASNYPLDFPSVTYEDAEFYGSDAKAVNQYDVSDEGFKTFDFDKMNLKYIANGKPLTPSNLTKDKILTMNSTKGNYYSTCFGEDYGKLVITNPTKGNGKNLLLLGDSYSNSLNHMLGTVYNTVVDIDSRFYESIFSEKANLKEIIDEYKIDEILVYQGITNSNLINFEDISTK